MKHADLWIVFGLIAIALVVVNINWNLVRYPSSDVFNARAELVLVAVTAGATIVAVWNAWLTRRLATFAHDELQQARAESVQQNKPVGVY